MINKILAGIVLAVVSIPALAAGDVAAGKEKASRCQACHGAVGKAAMPLYPHLAGQNPAYLAHALQAYKKGERKGGQAEVMKAFVAGLSDEDIDNLAAYYGSLKP